jgi:hypothetical protein
MVAVKLMLCALRHSPVSSEVILRRRHPIVSHRNELSYEQIVDHYDKHTGEKTEYF